MQNQNRNSAQPQVLTQQPIAHEPFRNVPVFMNCPSCGKQVATTLEYHPGLLTYLSCGGICLLGGTFGCCLIPFCVNSCKDVHHKCPHCQNTVGTYRKLRD